MTALHRFEWIAELVAKYGWTHGAEWGVCKGKTFFYLLEHCPNLHMVGVDLWAAQPDNPGIEDYTQPHWRHDWAAGMVAQKAKRIGRNQIIRALSTEAASEVEDGTLDFVFIDADHCAVAADIKAWKPKLKPTGKLIGHDIDWPTVREDVERLIINYKIGPDNCWIQT